MGAKRPSLHRRAAAPLAAMLLAAAALATAAQAQLGGDQGLDLYSQLEVGEKTGVDTDHTPRAKPDDEIWRQVAGARFGWDEQGGPEQRGVISGSATSFHTSLYAVAFRNTDLGFAGGSERVDCDSDGEPDTEVPVIFNYGRGASVGDSEVRWREVEREQIESGCDSPGYVGAIAWITTKRALAVGGTGTYPEREPAYSDACQELEPDPNTAGATQRPKGAYGVKCDPAGEGRAWLYDQGRWRELDLSREAAPCPAPPPEEWRCGMRGMSALDFDPRSGANFDFGVAGALGQLWHWEREGGGPAGFSAKHTQGVTTARNVDVTGGASVPIRFRVRDVEIVLPKGLVAGDFSAISVSEIFAVTAGCCAESPARNLPRLLTYEHNAARWRVHEIANRWAPRPDAATGGQEVNAEANLRQDIPDSFYSLTVSDYPVTSGRDSVLASMIATPGGPPDPTLERPSTLTPAYCMHGGGGGLEQSPTFGLGPATTEITDPLAVALRTNLSTARLVAGDGDTESSFGWYRYSNNGFLSFKRFDFRPSTFSAPSYQVGGQCRLTDHMRGQDGTYPDGVPDWAVGELRSTHKEGLGARALALATGLNSTVSPDIVNLGTYDDKDPQVVVSSPSPSDENLSDPNKATDWLVNDENLVEYLKSRYFLLPSYSLNAIDVIDPNDTGWAVGEHGAILRLGGDAGSQAARRQAEPPPPRLGSRVPARPPEREPYDAYAPRPSGEAGAVPALAERPRRRLAEPRLVGWGSPNPSLWTAGHPTEDVRQIVMSRDGSEGWALGPNLHFDGGGKPVPLATTLFHYDGQSWGRCDARGIEGQLEPDSACAALRDLPAYVRTETRPNGSKEKVPAPVRILAAARIPYEFDTDPTNDDEFEILATATLYRYPGEQDELPAVLRYREGRWELARDPASQGLRGLLSAAGPHEVALVGPDEGWILDGGALLHLQDGQWSRCESAECNPTLAERKVIGPHLAAAGDRVFLAGTRVVSGGGGGGEPDRTYPVILHRQRGPEGRWSADPERGGFDPGAAPSPDTTEQGVLSSFALVAHPGGGYEGWATGSFGVSSTAVKTGCVSTGLGSPVCTGQTTVESHAEATFLRLLPGRGWTHFADPGVFSTGAGTVLLVLPGGRAFATDGPCGGGRICEFDRERERWRRLPGPPLLGSAQALAPDGEGGFWGAASTTGGSLSPRTYFYRYTTGPHEPVFAEVKTPLRQPAETFTGLAASSDGTLWAASSRDALYRYDRLTGWDRVQIPGWIPRGFTGSLPPVNAVAVGPDGRGVAVGKEGRIANIGPREVALGAAAGTVCEAIPAPPCGTSRDLRAVAIAPDGSALAGGDYLSLLWRPAGGEFRAIERPRQAAASARITGIAMPESDRAWLSTATGLIFAGELREGAWRWTLENLTPEGDVVPLDQIQRQIPLRAIAVDASGHGYAVGDRGVILERTGEPVQPWRRLRTPFGDDFSSVALPGGGTGVLIGGRNGVILTGAGGKLSIARPADYPDRSFLPLGERTGPVIGLVLVAGPKPGQLEAWAATRGSNGNNFAHEEGFFPNPEGGRSQLLHYASDPDEPLLDPDNRVQEPLPDAPPPRPGELSFAAFGNSGCDGGGCGTEGQGRLGEIRRRIGEEIAARSPAVGGPAFAVFTGDALAEPGGGPELQKASEPHLKWAKEITDPLAEAGLPLFAAIGKRDLSEVPASSIDVADCFHVAFFACEAYHVGAGAAQRVAKTGENFAWRKAMADRPRPWGKGAHYRRGPLAFRPVGDGPLSVRAERASESLGGAATHYALDVIDESREEGREVARLVFVDNSLRSLAASDPFQNPLEAKGGQAAWLEEMLCVRGQSAQALGRCTRRPHQRAIVVATTPTYSHGPTENDELATDATAFEAILMRHRASLVVSGRLGWQGRYWATAPGVHEPCPGAEPQEHAPEAGRRACGQATPGDAGAAERLSDAIGAGAPALDRTLEQVEGSGLLPFVVASAAGGPYGALGSNAVAERGFWPGYSVVRLDPAGDPAATVVEQRPILDWLRIEAATHVLRPGQRMTLRGDGREPIGSSPAPEGSSGPKWRDIRYDAIRNAGITHRYDLVLADEAEPWLPKRDADGGYAPLPADVATIDSQTGRIRVGRGNHPRTFALGMLSAGEHVAAYPLVFESRRSFRPKPAQVLPSLPLPKVAASATAAIQSPQAPPPVNPPTPQVNIPPPPALPGLPTPSANPPAPPAPPAPPPPPVSPTATPLNLVTSPLGLNIAPQATVIPPPAPPIQPAPPGGARREARQRQAATQKSGADGAGSEVQEGGGDLATDRTAPDGISAATRRDPQRPAPSITTVRTADQPSAWARGALYGGGLTLASLLLATAYITTRPRPTPRRRPTTPAPAWARRRRL